MKKILKNLFLIIAFVILFSTNVFAAKYTMCTGKEFNTRIKYALNKTNNGVDRSITEFRRHLSLPEDAILIDISEDGDSSVLAFIDENILYYIADDDVYLNYDCSYMFDGFLAIKKINLQEFEFSKLKKANYMFSNCISLTDLDVDNDTDIKLNEMEGMFYNCQSITDLNLYMLVTKNVTSFKNLFYECRNLKNIQVHTDKFITKNVKDFTNTYKNCYLLKTNFGKKATSINENNYKMYSKCGDDDTEGLLKDFDFEYDDYGTNDCTYKVDSIFGTVFTTESLTGDEIKTAKTFLNAKLATDSSLQSASGKDSNQLQDIDVEAILRAESTFVPDLEEKIRLFKEKRKNGSNSNIEDEEDDIVGPGITPSKEPINYEDVSADEDYASYKQFDNSIYLVVIIILVTVIIGLLMYRRKTKKETDEIDKPFDN